MPNFNTNHGLTDGERKLGQPWWRAVKLWKLLFISLFRLLLLDWAIGLNCALGLTSQEQTCNFLQKTAGHGLNANRLPHAN